MDRQIVWPTAIALETDLLNTNRNVLVALGMMIQDILGTGTVAAGLACTPGTGLTVSIAPGRLYSLQNLDNTAYSSLPLDTTHQIMKQGILLNAATLAVPAPTTSGDSINYLIEAAYQDTDTGAMLLNFFNSNQPTQPYVGPNNNGQAVYTLRQGQVSLVAKAGAQAATGTQTTPAADVGYTGLYVVTIANGASGVVTGNITVASGAPFVALNMGAAPLAGVGTPTGGSILTNFPGASATLAQTSAAVSQLLTLAKARGWLET